MNALRKTLAIVGAGLLLAIHSHALAQPAVIGESRLVVGKETPHPYLPAAVDDGITWSDSVKFEGARFVKVQFTEFALGQDDYVIVRSLDGAVSFRYDSTAPPKFWSTSISSDEVIVELRTRGRDGGNGFRINGIAGGENDAICGPLLLCGVDEECTPPVGTPAYALRRPVCAIIYPDNPPGDLYQCTGYQIAFVTDHGYILTCKHCEPPGGWFGNAEAWFNAERVGCGAGALKPISKYDLYEICYSPPKPGLDYSLLESTPVLGELVMPPFWGKLSLRNTPAFLGEFVYRHHHSHGCEKQYSDGRTTQYVNAIVPTPVPNNPAHWNYVEYNAIGNVGSSGSPVIGENDLCVLAHHGYADSGGLPTPNPNCTYGKGSMMSRVLAHIKAQPGPFPHPVIPDLFWCLPPGVIECPTPPPDCPERNFKQQYNIQIPDGIGNGTPGAPAVAAIIVPADPDCPIISDLDVDFLISHTWQGDLRIRLRHVENNLTVTLVDRPGVPQTLFGFGEDNYGNQIAGVKFIADDFAPVVYDMPAVAVPGIANVSGAWKPENALAMFNGKDKEGTWELIVEDLAAFDVGIIKNFSLHFINVPGPCKGDTNNSGAVNVDDLLAVINSWGPCAGCPADIAPQPNGNDVVNVDDLLMVINFWGPCP